MELDIYGIGSLIIGGLFAYALFKEDNEEGDESVVEPRHNPKVVPMKPRVRHNENESLEVDSYHS